MDNLNILLFSRNEELQQACQRFKSACAHRFIIKNDLEDTLQRLNAHDIKRIDAVILDAESIKLLDLLQQQTMRYSLVCVVLISKEDEDTERKQQSLRGSFIALPLETTFAVIMSTIQASVHKVSKVDFLFKDIQEVRNREKDYPYISVFDQLPTTFDPNVQSKKAVDLICSQQLQSGTLFQQNIRRSGKQAERPTTVGGLDKKSCQNLWREVAGRSRLSQTFTDFIVSENGSEDARKITAHKLNSDYIDKLKLQRRGKASLISLVTQVPRNIQISSIRPLDLFSLKINLAERDILRKGLRYQDLGDFTRAIQLFSSGHQSKPYISKILLGNLYYQTEDYFKCIKSYQEAILLLQDLADEKPHFIALYNCALVYFRIGNDPQGLKYLTDAVELSHNLDLEAVELMALAQRRMGQHTESIKLMLDLSKTRADHKMLCQNSSVPERSNSPQCSMAKAEKSGVSSSFMPSMRKPPSITLTIRPHSFPAMIGKSGPPLLKESDVSTSSSSLLSVGNLLSYRIINGLKKEIAEELFDVPTPLQAALSVPSSSRSISQLNTIVTEALGLFSLLKNFDQSALLELAKLVKYVSFTSNAQLYNQQESPDSFCLLLSGEVQAVMEVPTGQVKPFLISKYSSFEAIGTIDLLFSVNTEAESSQLMNIPRIQQEEIFRSNLIRKDGSGEDTMETQTTIDKRAFHPNMFLTYNITSPSEILVIDKFQFDRYLANLALRELKRYLDVITSSRVFSGWSYAERVRLARMARMKTVRSGEIVLDQGEKPTNLVFILSGMCKVFKKPNDKDVLQRVIEYCLSN